MNVQHCSWQIFHCSPCSKLFFHFFLSCNYFQYVTIQLKNCFIYNPTLVLGTECLHLFSLVLDLFFPCKIWAWTGPTTLLHFLIWAAWKSIPAFVALGSQPSSSDLLASIRASLPYECGEFSLYTKDL